MSRTPNGTLIVRNPEILGGAIVFAGTRVPVRNLFERPEAGDTLAKLNAIQPRPVAEIRHPVME